MISKDQRIAAFVGFSEFLRNTESAEILDDWAQQAYLRNNWFVPKNVLAALSAIAAMLRDEERLSQWVAQYPEVENPATIGVVLAGNLPAVGFHDLLCVLISGHRLLVKPSKDDTVLIELILEKLCEIEPAFREAVTFAERINAADAYIATGSDNTARYFETYFASKPHIIRKNRVSVAVLSGNETTTELQGLCSDIFLYFGLGCRNVSKVYVPEGYAFSAFYETAEAFRDYAAHHHKYFNNYEYNKSILLVNGDEHLDNGFLLIQESERLVSPLSMIYFETYHEPAEVKARLDALREKIQCVVTGLDLGEKEVPFGKSQQPSLTDYPDGVDVMAFLSGIGGRKEE